MLDITSAGMRVICRRIPKNEVEFDLNTAVDPLPVQAKVVWTKRLGFRKHEVGLHFIQSSPELDNLIRCCSTLDGKVCLNPA
ncbi:MAG: PilZ domain-containing protein [Planctomycetes bacterium]|nr:PilZ domain-containing protein [Planctomycetota bacterium]